MNQVLQEQLGQYPNPFVAQMPPNLSSSFFDNMNLPDATSLPDATAATSADDTTTIASNSSSTQGEKLNAFYAASSKAQDKQTQRQQASENRMIALLTKFTNNTPTTPKGTYNNPNDHQAVPSNPRGHNKYCYKHGLCNHSSQDCNTKESGHKTSATYWNRLGGTNKGCPDK
jgi:hypothetical protein